MSEYAETCINCAYYHRYQLDPHTGYCGCGHSSNFERNKLPDEGCRHFELDASLKP